MVRSPPEAGRLDLCRHPACALRPKAKGRQVCPAALIKSLREEAYFRLLIAVRSNDSLAMPAAPHKLEPAPPGLIAVTLVVPVALKALVKALQSPLFRSVSE